MMCPGSFIAWLTVGLVSGWAAGSFTKASGYGMVDDIIIGPAFSSVSLCTAP